jgi:Small metal-binding protein
MKKAILTFSCLLLLLVTILSTAVFAAEHAYTAIEHTSSAIAGRKAAKTSELIVHSKKALDYAKMAEQGAIGHLKRICNPPLMSLKIPFLRVIQAMSN